MWLTSWPYRNAIKALLLKSGSCSSPTMWNHCTVWARILVGLIFSRSQGSRVSQCFWDRPFVSTVPHHSPSFVSFLQCCLLAFSRPPHPCISPVLLVGFMDLCSTFTFIFSSDSCLGCSEWVYLCLLPCEEMTSLYFPQRSSHHNFSFLLLFFAFIMHVLKFSSFYFSCRHSLLP